MANTQPEMVLAFEEAMPPIPQSTVVQEKNPWLAFGLSFSVPGLGQYYNGHNAKGTVQIVAATAGAVVMFSALEDDVKLINGDTIDPDDDNNVSAIGALVYLSSFIWSVVDAPMSANRINDQAPQASLQVNPVVKDDLVGASLTLKF